MTNEEIIKGNELIARSKYSNERLKRDMKGFEDRKLSARLSYVLENLNYHYDWSNLMEVIENISKVHYKWLQQEPYHAYDDCAYPRTFGMRDKNGHYMVRLNAQPLFTNESFILAAWQAVVYFIENDN